MWNEPCERHRVFQGCSQGGNALERTKEYTMNHLRNLARDDRCSARWPTSRNSTNPGHDVAYNPNRNRWRTYIMIVTKIEKLDYLIGHDHIFGAMACIRPPLHCCQKQEWDQHFLILETDSWYDHSSLLFSCTRPLARVNLCNPWHKVRPWFRKTMKEFHLLVCFWEWSRIPWLIK